MPDSIQDVIYIALTTIIVLGIVVIRGLVKTGFNRIIEGIDSLASEVRKEREQRIRSGARLWGEFQTMQQVCALRHGLTPQPPAKGFESFEDTDE
jgi:hypothetical protein